MPVLSTTQLSFQLDNGEWLFSDISFNLAPGLSGLVGRNGVGKSLFVSLLLGQLNATQGSVTRQGNIGFYSQLPSHLLDSNIRIDEYLGISEKLAAYHAIEQGSCKPEHFDLLGEDWEVKTRAQHTLEKLNIGESLDAYCHTLSGGQLALLQLHRLFESDADILLLDEPTNHLDSNGRLWLIEQLKHYQGQALIVSHDRQLLRQVSTIYQLTRLGLRFYSGNYDEYWAQSSAQSDALDKQITQVKSEQKKIERQAQANKEKAQQREAKGNRIRKSGSQPKILLDAMKERAGQSLSATATMQQNQRERSQDKLQALQQQKEQLKPQALYLQQSEQTKKRSLLSIKQCCLVLGNSEPVTFSLSQTERVHLSGANGCGKSTLLKAINGAETQYSGLITVNTNTVYMDQHFGLLNPLTSLLDNLTTHCSGLHHSTARTLLAGIGFRRDLVHREVALLSGGEKMKLAMLMVSHMVNSPLLLLDEPDNHLDIESKQLLAEALNTYKGAFILVSHDEDFVRDISACEEVVMS
ncbi:ABC transporter ATP-binding protein [Agarivorans sp. Toyoura001]|uniref:ABC-F family ATP-binding cassette domain-containing protein n=1 Tax=Agarivorans sp. Toyoura001 TaxID=2283141 RepID=UPI0010DC9830|nr:ATP-binding cassette domain-containing protein [Agarivorans sp. Toyoura001]GDY28013.1 ABC transporter ATP-binding protein [Agarivorans sp. Toyoura001]